QQHEDQDADEEVDQCPQPATPPHGRGLRGLPVPGPEQFVDAHATPRCPRPPTGPASPGRVNAVGRPAADVTRRSPVGPEPLVRAVVVPRWGTLVAHRRPSVARATVRPGRSRTVLGVSTPEWPDTPDVDVLVRVRDGLRSLPEQERRVPDAGSSPT